VYGKGEEDFYVVLEMMIFLAKTKERLEQHLRLGGGRPNDILVIPFFLASEIGICIHFSKIPIIFLGVFYEKLVIIYRLPPFKAMLLSKRLLIFTYTLKN
jgi:hypothetical protein